MFTKENLNDMELFVLDMDGTIYLGNNVFPEALRFYKEAKAKGKRVIFFTNNASMNPDIYVKRLTGMGFDVCREDVVTSGDVTAAYLNLHHKGEPVYLIGTPALHELFAEAGIPISEEAKIVVSSFDTTLVYSKLNIGVNLIRKGAIFYSTHPDFVCPAPDGVLPDSGAICALITACTGVLPKYFGKPEKETADMISHLFGVPYEKTCIVGDRLYTDIALGKRNGLLSVLVLTGESTLADVNDDNAPDVILNNIGEILDYLD